jgi:hypothetical protein
MIRIISRGAALLIAAVFLFGGVTAFAAETPEPAATPGAVDALHNGAPPAIPGTSPTTPGSYEPIPPTTAVPQTTLVPPPPFSTPTPEPPPEPESTPDVPALYPSDVRGVEENGARWMIKTYELGEGESPDGIAREGFELDGWQYELTDIIRKETAAADTREHTETITVNTETKDMAAIIKLLAPALDFTSEDGYAGTLTLDIATIKVEQAGTKTSSYTVSATREYPHLSAADTSLIPKTITDSGRTLTLASVDWRAQNTVAVDYEQLPESYTAVATYATTGSKTVVTGYVTAAEYKGTIAKLITGKTVYTAYFAGTLIAAPTPKPTPEPTASPEPTPEPAASEPVNPLPAAAGATAGVGLLGGIVFFFFLRKNVKIHNLKDGKYTPIGKARVTAKNPVVNLTPFADRAATGSFILVLDALAAKSLSGKTVTVNYGDRSFQHIIEGGGGEYQFEVDF